MKTSDYILAIKSAIFITEADAAMKNCCMYSASIVPDVDHVDWSPMNGGLYENKPHWAPCTGSRCMNWAQMPKSKLGFCIRMIPFPPAPLIDQFFDKTSSVKGDK